MLDGDESSHLQNTRIVPNLDFIVIVLVRPVFPTPCLRTSRRASHLHDHHVQPVLCRKSENVLTRPQVGRVNRAHLVALTQI